MKILQEGFRTIIKGLSSIFNPQITYNKTIPMPYNDDSFRKLIETREEIKNDK